MTEPSASDLARNALWQNNPAVVQLLGLCPLLAVSTSTVNALGLGLATLVVVTVASTAVSALRPITRPQVRLPLFVLVIASAVSSVDLLARAWLPGLHEAIGLFIPLIVTNCMILGRAEAFAARHRVGLAALDGALMGSGLLAVLVAVGALRELLGQGTLFADLPLLLGDWSAAVRLDLAGGRGLLLAVLPAGAFFVFAGLVAARNALVQRAAARAAVPGRAP